MMNGMQLGNMDSMGGIALWFGAHGWVMPIVAIALVLPFWQIFSKAGFSGWLSLLMLIPMINLIVLYVVAFSRWPANRGRTVPD